MIRVQEKIIKLVEGARAHVEQGGGLKALYFVGCGGSWACMTAAKLLVERESATPILTGHVSSNEFVHAVPKSVDKNAVVVLTSMKATPETLRAVELARERGAYTIAVTGFDDSPMAKTAHDYVVYTHSENWTAGFHSPAVALRIAYEILHQVERYPLYTAAVEAMDSLNGLYAHQAKQAIPRAVRFALDNADKELFHVFSCGAMAGAGYTACYCHLAEMQQRNAIPIHCGEYFHGAFETTVPGQASVLFMGLGSTRPLDERIRRFLEQYCDCLTVVDAAQLGLEGIDPAVAEYMAPLLLSPVFKLYVEEMANQRRHPMNLRRYMWRMDY